MDRLPSDVILLIVHRLAVQDPLSLVPATCALAPFHRVLEEIPSMWREAFYGSAANQEPEGMSTFTALDAEVDSLGGYRSLLVARLCSPSIRHCQSKQCQNDDHDAPGTPSRSFQSRSYRGKNLVLVRLQTRLFLWGLSDRHHRLTCLERSNRSDGWIRLLLHVLHPVNALREAWKTSWDHSIEDASWRSQGLTVELYTLDKRRQGPLEPVPSCLFMSMMYEELSWYVKPILVLCRGSFQVQIRRFYSSWRLDLRATPIPEFWWKVEQE